ncbi:hypothetical protein OH76DRAFT_218824 [Lentinus brumalis]|uniref:HhH-GPD domain-containing protein n=1 Tax=Lentinus brumalis TaxID=2498619 RepID=A0A371CMC1_9APHY|nr:hypothetical protein OH76DRAFT_218824 [Polyporus brumalis]
MHSRYFSSPSDRNSRFFPPVVDIDELKSDSSFCAFYEDFVAAMTDLYCMKPTLIQEHVSESPWKLLIAVTLLNKTAGKKSIPVFFDIIRTWPTPDSLAQAPLSLLFELLRDLGFGEKRAHRLVDISRTFLVDPPVPARPRPSRGYTTALSEARIRTVRYPPTPVSHVPGCGPYALDSYRIFCGAEGEWKSVRPTDKELTKYLQWRWAIEAYRKWDPVYGPGNSIDLEYVRALTELLRRDPVEH